MKKFLACAVVLALTSPQLVRCSLAADKEEAKCCGEKDKKNPERTDICICLIEELMDFGFFSMYAADRREHACDSENCDEATAVSWYGREDWPQICQNEGDCMPGRREEARKENSERALEKPVGPLYEPVFAGHLSGVAKIIHVDCITIAPPDREPLTAKVFLVFIDAHKIGTGENQLDRPAQVSAMGVEVDSLGPSRDADTTVQDKLFPNVYHAKVGCTNYTILTTAKKK